MVKDIDGIKIKQVEKYEYLGRLITSDAKSDEEYGKELESPKQHLKLYLTCSLREKLLIK